MEHLPSSSALHRAVSGTRYTAADYLLVVADNALRTLVWQFSGGRGKRPDPFFLPGMVPEDEEKLTPEQWKGDAMSIAEMDDWLGWNRGE